MFRANPEDCIISSQQVNELNKRNINGGVVNKVCQGLISQTVYDHLANIGFALIIHVEIIHW